MISGPFQCARMKSRSFQVTEESKLVRIQAKKSSSPEFLPSTGATLPRLCGRPCTRRPTPIPGGHIACQMRRALPANPGAPASPERRSR
ncbi:MAG: hypothetical protein WDN44_07085 [Sphingomonas sp.]